MSNFVLTFLLKTQPYQEHILNKRLEIGRQIYNACLGELHNRYRKMKQAKEYQKVVKMNKGKERNKLFYVLNKKYGLTEYSLHTYVKSMQKHFKSNIDSHTAQKIATRVFNAFQKLILHIAEKVYYKKYNELNSLEGKSNETGIRFVNNIIHWRKLLIPIVIKRNDTYAQMALCNKVKYCRIVRKLIRGKYKFYVQLVLDGIPPKKINNITGEIKQPRNNGVVGLDIGTQTIAISSENGVKLLELAPKVNNIEREKRILNRKLDRQRKSNNPTKFNNDNTIKTGDKNKWINSNNYIKTKNELAELQRKVAVIRKQSHNELANYILSLGNSIKVEKMDFLKLQTRNKETTINEKSGKYNSKKRFGKSLLNKAPSMFLTILDNKLKFEGSALKKVDTYLIRASQYNHFTGEYIKKSLNNRWNTFECGNVQRDLYSAFLIMNVNEDLKTINRDWCFEKFDKFKEMHDIEIERVRNNECKLIGSMGV